MARLGEVKATYLPREANKDEAKACSNPTQQHEIRGTGWEAKILGEQPRILAMIWKFSANIFAAHLVPNKTLLEVKFDEKIDAEFRRLKKVKQWYLSSEFADRKYVPLWEKLLSEMQDFFQSKSAEGKPEVWILQEIDKQIDAFAGDHQIVYSYHLRYYTMVGAELFFGQVLQKMYGKNISFDEDTCPFDDPEINSSPNSEPYYKLLHYLTNEQHKLAGSRKDLDLKWKYHTDHSNYAKPDSWRHLRHASTVKIYLDNPFEYPHHFHLIRTIQRMGYAPAMWSYAVRKREKFRVVLNSMEEEAYEKRDCVWGWRETPIEGSDILKWAFRKEVIELTRLIQKYPHDKPLQDKREFYQSLEDFFGGVRFSTMVGS